MKAIAVTETRETFTVRLSEFGNHLSGIGENVWGGFESFVFKSAVVKVAMVRTGRFAGHFSVRQIGRSLDRDADTGTRYIGANDILVTPQGVVTPASLFNL